MRVLRQKSNLRKNAGTFRRIRESVWCPFLCGGKRHLVDSSQWPIQKGIVGSENLTIVALAHHQQIDQRAHHLLAGAVGNQLIELWIDRSVLDHAVKTINLHHVSQKCGDAGFDTRRAA